MTWTHEICAQLCCVWFPDRVSHLLLPIGSFVTYIYHLASDELTAVNY